MSLIAARFGVKHPRWDVVEIVLKGPGREPTRLPPFSLSAVLVQFLLLSATFVAVRALSPGQLYDGVLRPTATLVLAVALCAAVLVGVAGAWWRGAASATAHDVRLELDR